MIMVYARAVWVEHGKEVEGTAPDNWIDVDNKTIRWPKKGEKAAFLNQHPPQDDWMTFTLVKRKMTSVSIRECDDYDLTSYVEEEEEENEEVDGRKKTKRKFDDYVLESDDLEEEEENMTGAIIKAPSFPIPPTKVTKSIQMESTGSRKKIHGNPAHSNVNQASQSKGAGSSHQSSHSDGSWHSDRSVHSKRYRHRKQSRHSDQSRDSDGFRNSKRYRHRKQSRDSDGSRHSDRSGDSNQMGHSKQSMDDYEGVQTPISRYSGRSFSEQSNRSSAHESSHTEPRSETDIRFPMAMEKFQKKVLTKLVDIYMEVRRLGRSEPPLSSAHIEQLETMEEFEREEERLKDKQAFESLVLKLARIGGKDVRDCVHKIFDRLFTNRLMAKFNMKGKGKRQKQPLETTKTFEAFKAAVMKWDKEATEATIKHHAAEHLKHAPGRKGGGGHTGVE